MFLELSAMHGARHYALYHFCEIFQNLSNILLLSVPQGASWFTKQWNWMTWYSIERLNLKNWSVWYNRQAGGLFIEI